MRSDEVYVFDPLWHIESSTRQAVSVPARVNPLLAKLVSRLKKGLNVLVVVWSNSVLY